MAQPQPVLPESGMEACILAEAAAGRQHGQREWDARPLVASAAVSTRDNAVCLALPYFIINSIHKS